MLRVTLYGTGLGLRAGGMRGSGLGAGIGDVPAEFSNGTADWRCQH